MSTLNRGTIRNDPRLVILDNGVYDLSTFSAKHPGGAGPLLAAGGTDVTSLFHSMHRRTEKDLNRYRALLEEYKVGQVAVETAPGLTFESDFSKDLYSEVCKVLPPSEWWADRTFWVRTILILVATVICEAIWIATGRVEACFAVGICHAQIGLAVQHDASHGAISRDWRVNSVLAYGADIIGNSRWLWFQQHIIGHHPNTNDGDRDPDTTSAEPFLLFRTLDFPARKVYHRLQHIFMYPVLAMYGPSVVFNLAQLWTLNHADEVPVQANKFFQRQWLLSVALRVFYWIRTIFLPHFVGGAPLFLASFGVNFVTGFFLTFVFVLSHNFVGSNRFPAEHYKDWFQMQVETSCTYGGTWSGFFTGGLNMQIEHHLFPRMCSIHYGKIAPVVKRVCDKHGVKYTHFQTIFHNIASTLEFMRQNGASKLRID